MNADAAWAISDSARESLERCELLRGLSKQHLMEIAALVEECSLQPDEVMLDEGEAARYLFVVIEGRAVAQLALYRGWLSLGLVGPSDVAGWSSLVGAQVYPASVRALTPMRVARIEAKGLTLLMRLHPAVGYSINRRLSLVFSRQYQAALDAFKTSG